MRSSTRRSKNLVGSKRSKSTAAQPRGANRKLLAAVTAPVGAQSLESLEPRVLFSTFSVTTSADSGAGSLRQAILNANANPGADQISFNIPGTGVHAMSLASALPSITDTVTLDATTQPGYAGSPKIVLNGGNTLANGLTIAAPGSKIAGLDVGGFTNSGITILASGSGSSVSASYIGVDSTGSNSLSNDNGIVVQAGNVTIGGLAAAGNVISGNQRDGLLFSGVTSGSVLGNTIGLDSTGSHVLGNARNGIDVQNSTSVAIAGNIISANFANGVNVVSSSGVTITGNLIGTDATGTLAVDGFMTFGNSGNGVSFGVDAVGNTVGGPTVADRNIIANNSGDGVRFDTSGGVASGSSIVQGNYIGTDVTGSIALPNSGNGLTVVEGSLGVTVAGNLISGNGNVGVWLEDVTTVQGNSIGLAADGVSPLGNGSDGISLFESSDNGATIGGASASLGNAIAFNGGNGIGIYGGSSVAIRGNSIHDNSLIGIDLGGDGVTPNDSLGHTGPNNYANFPVITSIDNAAGTVTVTGTLDSSASMSFYIDFFSSAMADPSGYGPGQTLLGSTVVTTDAAGHATFTVQFTDVSLGQNVLAATATDFNGNTSEFSFGQAIPAPRLLAGSVTSLGSSANPSILNQPIMLTATVAPMNGPGVPSGMVDFKDGSVELGSAAVVNGVASLVLSSLGVGSHTLTAVYSGDSAFATSSSAVVSQTVNKIPTSTSVISSSPMSTVGDSVTFTATVTGGTPTGLVAFFDNGNFLSSTTVSSGVATFTTSLLATGSHTITAAYQSDASCAASTSAGITQTVGSSATATTLSSSSPSSQIGVTIVLTAHVTSLLGIPSVGSVTFSENGVSIGTAPVLNGFAALSISTLAAGTHNLVATYSGATDFSASASTPMTQTVGKAATSVSLGSSSQTSAMGQMVAIGASILTSVGSPTGSVTFMDGAVTLGSVSVVSNVATLKIATLSAGSHTITAIYSGDASFAGCTSATMTQTVTQASSSTALALSAGSITFGQSATCTATVTSTVGVPTGSVVFKDGSTVLGTVPLVNGVASLSAGSLALGSHSITATYSGDTNFTASASSAMPLSVAMANSSTALTVSANPATVGQSLTLTATISAAGAVGGTVTFFDGATAIGSATVTAGVAKLSIATLSVASHQLKAVYSGDANHAGSTSAVVVETISAAATNTAMTSSASSATTGQSITLTATVSSSLAGVGGLVTFFDGSTMLGTATLANGSASLAVSSLGAGSHTLSVSYAGDATHASSKSANVAVTVTAPTTTAGTISGHVLDDKNKPMPGVLVILYRDKNGNGKVNGNDVPIDFAVTDAKGAYLFKNVKSGKYVVQQIVPCGYRDESPVGDNYAVTLGSGSSASASNLDFIDEKKTGGRDFRDLILFIEDVCGWWW